MVTESITVIAAASNEAAQAAEWLEQLHWVQRVLVIDTGSQDGTEEILVRGGAEVQRFTGPPTGLIHAAKNQAIRQVSTGWILDLDLDERIPLPLRREILERTSDPGAPAAFQVPFRHYVFGRWLRHGGWRDPHLRLYRAGVVIYPEDRAHSTPQVEGTVGELREAVVHFAHPTLHDFHVKMNRYTSQDAPLILSSGRGGLRNRAPLPARPRTWAWASFSVFWSRYVKAAGFRDGIPGLLAAAMVAAYVFVEQAKVWELTRGVESRSDET
ncbi:MAG: glycosyltransferase family 2 protein [Planctomycetota bacterium]